MGRKKISIVHISILKIVSQGNKYWLFLVLRAAADSRTALLSALNIYKEICVLLMVVVHCCNLLDSLCCSKVLKRGNKIVSAVFVY